MRRMVSVLAVLLSACAGSAGVTEQPGLTESSVATSSTTTTASMPTTTQPTVSVVHDAGTTEIIGTPTRIAALSSVHVEMLFAIDAGDQVIAGDLFSNYPAAADELLKLDSFNLNVEEIVALDPDLVTLSFDPGGVVEALTTVGIPTLLLGTAPTVEAAYDQMETLGLATGHSREAVALTERMAADIDAIATQYREQLSGITFYHEVDAFSFYTPNSSSFIGQFYALLSMENIADAAPDEFNSGFPQLSPEFIVSADPFVIVLASFGETADSVAARDGWDAMTAVREGRILPIDSDAAGRWGPRIVDVFREIAEGVAELVP